MRTWVTIRYEDNKLAIQLAGSGAHGKRRLTTTAFWLIPADDPAVAIIQAACDDLMARHADDLAAEVDLAVARATVYAADRPKES